MVSFVDIVWTKCGRRPKLEQVRRCHILWLLVHPCVAPSASKGNKRIKSFQTGNIKAQRSIIKYSCISDQKYCSLKKLSWRGRRQMLCIFSLSCCEYIFAVNIFTPPLKQMWRKFGKVAVPPVFANSKLHFLAIHIRKVSLCHELLFSFAWSQIAPSPFTESID